MIGIHENLQEIFFSLKREHVTVTLFCLMIDQWNDGMVEWWNGRISVQRGMPLCMKRKSHRNEIAMK